MTQLLLDYGLVILFLLVAIESAGVPLPGETALVAAAVLAHEGHYSLVAVIVVAAAAAIAGDNVGYWLGRAGGRKLLNRFELTRRYAAKALPPSERFFRKHGAKTVFFGRFIALLRVTAAWLAGISRMEWWRFFAWNAAGGIAWAAGIAILAYLAGGAVAEAVNRYGLYGAIVAVVLVVVVVVAAKVWRNRMVES